MSKPKTAARPAKRRLAMICPTCNGEVKHRRYSFQILRPDLKRMVYFVCDQCEADLSGADPVARVRVEQAFLDFLEASHALTA